MLLGDGEMLVVGAFCAVAMLEQISLGLNWGGFPTRCQSGSLSGLIRF